VNPPTPQRIEFAIDAEGVRHWNGEALSRQEAAERFAAEGQRQPQPEVYLRADQRVPYRLVAETLADASKAGLSKVGFVSTPETR
jgi:biopolymer transport protein ExbD